MNRCELCGEISGSERQRVDGLLLCERCQAGARAAADLVSECEYERGQNPAIMFLD